jgi:hypothetical protein
MSELSTPDDQDKALVFEGFHTLHASICRRSDLTWAAKIAYSVLVSYHRFNAVFPGHDRMAYEMGCSKLTVVRAMQELVQARLPLVKRRGRGLPNVYTLAAWSKPQK